MRLTPSEVDVSCRIGHDWRALVLLVDERICVVGHRARRVDLDKL
jgi:hypothetical protein